nr:hypothetical protein [Tanacetum cinerariifolium]
MSHEEAKEKESESDSEIEVRISSLMIESSKKKRLKKFAFFNEQGESFLMTELIDLLGLDVVKNMYKAKVKYDKYYDKTLNRKTLGKITNCDLLSRGNGPITLKVHMDDGFDETIQNFKASDLHLGKGPITLKVYRDDGSDETIQNFKASDLHLGEWREVMNVCPNRTGEGWTTIYSQIN